MAGETGELIHTIVWAIYSVAQLTVKITERILITRYGFVAVAVPKYLLEGSFMATNVLGKILGTLAKWVAFLLPMVTPEIRKMAEKFIAEFEVKAKATPNIWDDALVDILKALFNVK